MRLTTVLRKDVLPESLKKSWNFVQRRIDAYNFYLQRNYPKIYELQTALTTGAKGLFIEGKEYTIMKYHVHILRKPSEQLTYRQLYLRNQYPRELWKLGPVLGIMILPFSTFLLLPIIYFFPKYFLTQHFWTEAQKERFAAAEIRERLRQVPFLVMEMQRKLPFVKDPNNREACSYLLNQLKQGKIIHEKDILETQDEFRHGEFKFEKLSPDYQYALAKLNNVYSWNALYTANSIGNMDLYLEKHLDLKMSNQEVRDAVQLRCLFPYADQEVLRDFLDIWTSTSTLVKEPSPSLRLHLPVFLSFPHPVNAEFRP